MGSTSTNKHVLHFIYALRGGGAERQLNLLAAASAQQGITASVFCVESDDDGSLKAAGVRVIRFARRGKFDLRFFAAARQAIDDLRPDVIHVWLPPVVSIPAMLAARYRGVPCIFSYRNRQEIQSAREVIEFLVAAVCADKVISNNPVGQSSWPYRMLFSRRDGEAIPNAVEMPAVDRESTARSSCADPARLLFVGRLTAQKNIVRLLEALSLVRSRRRWVLDVFGVGEQEELARSLAARHGPSGQIRFRGFSSRVLDEMMKADVLLFPSLHEGMPNVLLEALAVGLPVIASRIPGNVELLRGHECVVWIDPTSPEDMAQKIGAVLDSQIDLGSKVCSGREVARFYGVEGMVEKYVSAYRRLADKT